MLKIKILKTGQQEASSSSGMFKFIKILKCFDRFVKNIFFVVNQNDPIIKIFDKFSN